MTLYALALCPDFLHVPTHDFSWGANHFMNPFDTPVARRHSSLLREIEGKPLDVRTGDLPRPIARHVWSQFRSLVKGSEFPCWGAKEVFSRLTYRFGLYDSMGDRSISEGLCFDLYEFIKEQNVPGGTLEGNFTSFVATFINPTIGSELQFHELLWNQLQVMRDLDRPHHPWASGVESNVDSPFFSYSFAKRAFFVVGLNPASSRWSRRFAWPTIVFNAHYQFEKLREIGRFDSMRAAIRRRDVLLQGSVNPALADFGEAPESLQYSGLPPNEMRKCPFEP